MKFNILVIAVTKMKFICGVLLGMHDRIDDGVFHLAILALHRTYHVSDSFLMRVWNILFVYTRACMYSSL